MAGTRPKATPIAGSIRVPGKEMAGLGGFAGNRDANAGGHPMKDSLPPSPKEEKVYKFANGKEEG